MTQGPPPPENLVIYEVEGVPGRSAVSGLGPGYLGLWEEGGYTFFFFDREAGVAWDRFLAERTGLNLRYVHRMKYEQWQDGARFEPFQVGPLAIVPAWEAVNPWPGQLLIRLDPGLAFGFGGHFTTRSCLEALIRVYRADRPAMVLDLGAGTGVLALAAARLGAERAVAVESSQIAAETAARNVILNGLEKTVEVVYGRAEEHLNPAADLVLANLHFAAQNAVLEAGGYDRRRWLILSGLFHQQAALLEQGLAGRGYRLEDRSRDPRWATLLFRAA